MASPAPEKRPLLPQKGATSRQLLRWSGTILSALLFVWLLARQNWVEVWSHLSKTPEWAFPAALGLYLTGMLANALRWQVLLQAPKIRIALGETVKIVFAGAFASNFLPSTIGGDALRLVGLLRFNPDRAVSLASIVLDRLINLCAFLTVLPFTFTAFGSPLPILRELLGWSPRMPAPALAGLVAPLQKARRKMTHWLGRGSDAFRIWLRQPLLLVVAFIVSWFSIFVIFVAIWVLARGFAIPVTLFQVMGVTAVTYLVTLLPISVNGYGLREIVLTGLYTRLGASIEQATTLAVVTRFMSMTVTLPGALWVSQIVSLEKSPLTEQPDRRSGSPASEAPEPAANQNRGEGL